MGFIALIALKRLGMELAFPIAGDLEIFDPTSRCGQIARIAAEALAFAFGATLSPGSSNERIQFLAHHQLSDRAHGALSQGTQMLMKFVRLWHRESWLLRH